MINPLVSSDLTEYGTTVSTTQLHMITYSELKL